MQTTVVLLDLGQLSWSGEVARGGSELCEGLRRVIHSGAAGAEKRSGFVNGELSDAQYVE